MSQTVLITGASSGIGAAFASAYAAKHHNLVLVARRKNKLDDLAADLEGKFNIKVEVLAYDLADPSAPQNIKGDLDSRGLTVDILINNAGYGVPGTFLANSWETHAASNQVMVTAVAELTHLLVPAMITNEGGAVVNVASIAGLIPSTAGHTLYGAVKSWMIHFSDALCAELKSSKVSVLAVCPGFTYSEFHDVTGTRESVSKLPKLFWLSSEEVVEKSITKLATSNIKTSPIYVPGKFNKCLVGLIRILPKFIIIKFLNRYNHVARVANN